MEKNIKQTNKQTNKQTGKQHVRHFQFITGEKKNPVDSILTTRRSIIHFNPYLRLPTETPSSQRLHKSCYCSGVWGGIKFCSKGMQTKWRLNTKDEGVIDRFALEVCYTSYNCNNSIFFVCMAILWGLKSTYWDIPSFVRLLCRSGNGIHSFRRQLYNSSPTD